MVLERLGRWDEALADVDSAIGLNARNGQYWYSRGKIHDATKSWTEALTDFERGRARV
jgi:tetratricopeptide (TPR) repeat protein